MQRPTPVRKIPISTRAITGQLADQQFESALERDLLMQIAWDDEVEWFATQPVTIHYGEGRRYTPDVLVQFKALRPDSPAPLLCEVKYRRELSKHWRELRHKFRAAQHYCAERGWRFVVLDENAIRTPRLENIKFLWRYRQSTYPDDVKDLLLQQLRMRVRATRAEIFSCLPESWSQELRLQAVWTWWVLVARGIVAFDQSQRLSETTTFTVGKRLT